MRCNTPESGANLYEVMRVRLSGDDKGIDGRREGEKGERKVSLRAILEDAGSDIGGNTISRRELLSNHFDRAHLRDTMQRAH